MARACRPTSLAFCRWRARSSAGNSPPFISASTSWGMSSSSTKRRTLSCQARAPAGSGWGIIVSFSFVGMPSPKSLRHARINRSDGAGVVMTHVPGDAHGVADHVVELAQADLLLREVALTVGAGGQAHLHGLDQVIVFEENLVVDAAGEPPGGAHLAVVGRQAVHAAAHSRLTGADGDDLE